MSIERENSMNSLYTFIPKTNRNYELKNMNSDFFERIKMYSNSKQKNIRKLTNEVHDNIPHPRSSVGRSRDNSISLTTSIDKIYDFHRKKKENIKKIEKSMLNVIIFY